MGISNLLLQLGINITHLPLPAIIFTFGPRPEPERIWKVRNWHTKSRLKNSVQR
jgi:hypothetical protein